MQELQQIDYEDVRQFAGEYRELLYDLPVQIPDDILYLGRCVAILSGMCTALDPNFNVWKGLAPVAEELIREEAGALWEEVLNQVFDWGKLVIQLPKRVDSALTKLEKGRIAVRTPELERRLARLEQSNRKLVGAVIFAALLTGGIQLSLNGAEIPGGILLTLAVLSLGWVFFAGSGSSR